MQMWARRRTSSRARRLWHSPRVDLRRDSSRASPLGTHALLSVGACAPIGSGSQMAERHPDRALRVRARRRDCGHAAARPAARGYSGAPPLERTLSALGCANARCPPW
eukprot:1693362-Prymnesium_polylepis.1